MIIKTKIFIENKAINNIKKVFDNIFGNNPSFKLNK